MGEYPYVGLLCGEERPIGRNDIRDGGFICSVSGKRRGKGSSREASPYAERAAGLRVVIGENIERIYGENCANIGLLASTDFSLIEKIRHGEEIPLEAFIGDAGRIQRDIIEYGGLLDYAVARLKGLVGLPEIETPPDRPQTIAEKILARHWVADAASDALGVRAVKPGDTGFVRADLRFSHEYVTPMASTFWEEFAGDAELSDTASIIFFRDHLAFLDEVITEERKAAGLLDAAHALHDRQREFAAAKGVCLHGELPDRTGSEGICHIVVQDRYALPGQVIIGERLAHAALRRAGVRRVRRGHLGDRERLGHAGRATRGAGVDPRPHDGNAAARRRGEGPDPGPAPPPHREERGGDRPDHRVHGRRDRGHADRRTRDADQHGGRGRAVSPASWRPTRRPWPGSPTGAARRRDEIRSLCEGLHSDPRAEYAATIEMDASRVEPMVATPGDPGNGLPLSALDEDVALDLVFVGSCTGSKRTDFEMYAGVAREAVAAGRQVPVSVRAYAQYGSVEVEAWSRERGHDRALREAGFEVLAPGVRRLHQRGTGSVDVT